MANKRISFKDAFLCPKSLTSEARCSGEIGSFLVFGFPIHACKLRQGSLPRCFHRDFSFLGTDIPGADRYI